MQMTHTAANHCIKQFAGYLLCRIGYFLQVMLLWLCISYLSQVGKLEIRSLPGKAGGVVAA